jgi:hypothetical protein
MGSEFDAPQEFLLPEVVVFLDDPVSPRLGDRYEPDVDPMQQAISY